MKPIHWIMGSALGLIALVGGAYYAIEGLRKPDHQSDDHMARMRAAKARKQKETEKEVEHATETDAKET